MNGTRKHQEFDSSDEERGEPLGDHPGDYSTRLEELLSDTEDGPNDDSHDGHGGSGDDDDDEGGFVYSGVDAASSGGYREQLRDVLGPDHEDDELDEQEVEHSLLHDVEEKEHLASLMADEARVRRVPQSQWEAHSSRSSACWTRLRRDSVHPAHSAYSSLRCTITTKAF